MIGFVLLAVGLVLVIEGLVYALAPWIIEDLLTALKSLSPDMRRASGLGAVAIGVALIWIARGLGAV